MRVAYIGSLKTPFLREGIDQYRKWLSRYGKFEVVPIPSGGDIHRMEKETIVQNEAKLVLKSLRKDDFLVLLDEQGEELDSLRFADFLSRISIERKDLFFLIGGYLGVDGELRKRANHILSLSKFTFTHEIALFLLFEQLFRAVKINRGEKYHY